jgi:hypothetical protein
VELIPIDHGLCLPETLDEPYFEWLHWPQASIPFSKEELEYIDRLDPAFDCSLLREELPSLREACLRMLVLSTTFLKLAALEGLTLCEIGGMMTRELCGVEEEASELEKVCVLAMWEAKKDFRLEEDGVEDSLVSEDFSAEDDNVQFEMDDDDEVPELKLPERAFYSPTYGCRSISPRAPLSPQQWSLNDSSPEMVLPSFQSLEISAFPRSPLGLAQLQPSPTMCDSYSLSRMSSLKLNPKFRSHTQIEKPRPIGLRGYAALNVTQAVRDASEDGRERPESPLVLTDMNEKVWSLFLVHLTQLLPESFLRVKLKSKNQVQRLGTSCRF